MSIKAGGKSGHGGFPCVNTVQEQIDRLRLIFYRWHSATLWWNRHVAGYSWRTLSPYLFAHNDIAVAQIKISTNNLRQSWPEAWIVQSHWKWSTVDNQQLLSYNNNNNNNTTATLCITFTMPSSQCFFNCIFLSSSNTSDADVLLR